MMVGTPNLLMNEGVVFRIHARFFTSIPGGRNE